MRPTYAKPNRDWRSASRILLAAAAAWAVSHPDDCHSQVLSADEAARLAARLANDECARLYLRRPFSAEQHSAVSGEQGYRWGGLDLGGPGGYSALVTFRHDGKAVQVKVYLSTDALSRQIRQLPSGAAK
jgi:hypothetical protein